MLVHELSLVWCYHTPTSANSLGITTVRRRDQERTPKIMEKTAGNFDTANRIFDGLI
jgi:hypothetical protein